MLDRKEEHLAAGNRPSSVSKIKAGVAADGMLTAFDAESWGTGGAGAGAGFPLPYIYAFPNRRRKHRDVFTNAGPAARDARARTSAGVLPHRDADGRARRQGPRWTRSSSASRTCRRKRPIAMWRKYFPIARREVRLDQAPSDRRSDAGPDQARHGLRGQPVGRRRPRHQGALRDQRRRQRRHALRHAGHRRRHAHASSRWSTAETLGMPDGDGEGRDRRQQLPVQRRLGGSTTSRVGARRRSASRRARRSTRWRRAWRRRSASTPAALVAGNGRIHVEGRRRRRA